MATSVREKALQLLARRDHSRHELARKLDAHGDADEVAAVLARMEELGLQSDQRFAESYVRNRAARLGRRRLTNELQQRGIDGALTADILAQIPEGSELERAREVWRKKFADRPVPEADRMAQAREYARQARFLAGRGFDPDVIRQVLREQGQGNDDEPA